ncbi:hypothetical protein, partial [Rodentibacter mrazii]|uniref:hypothetical protein n=1 Tax=Rodentibacter mrazii TaxID=1908257 RepID=UPI00130134A4
SNSELSNYSCGASLHILLEKLENKKIVLDIWKTLFKNENYSTNDFFNAIQKHPLINKATIEIIHDFIYNEGGIIRAIELLNIK